MHHGIAIAKRDINFDEGELSWGYFKHLPAPPKILAKSSEFIIKGYVPDLHMFSIDVDGALVTFYMTEDKFRDLFTIIQEN